MDGDPGRPPLLPSVSVILHRTTVAENIGAVARVMANTGFSRLVLSDPRVSDLSPAFRTAVSADSVLREAATFPSLGEALSGAAVEFVVGLTARSRSYWRVLPLAEGVPLVLARAAAAPVGLVFGPESAGLTNDDLDRCQLLLTLPTAGPVTSYNLSHAVLLVLFSLMTAVSPVLPPPAPPGPPGDHPATREELEGMYAHLEEMLTAAGFLWEDNPEHMMRLFRDFLGRSAPRKREVQALRGVCRTMLWRIRGRG